MDESVNPPSIRGYTSETDSRSRVAFDKMNGDTI